jgi:hypothetical protein
MPKAFHFLPNPPPIPEGGVCWEARLRMKQHRRICPHGLSYVLSCRKIASDFSSEVVGASLVYPAVTLTKHCGHFMELQNTARRRAPVGTRDMYCPPETFRDLIWIREGSTFNMPRDEIVTTFQLLHFEAHATCSS